MFDIGMFELLVIGIVALIVVGPKDLPGMFRTLGRFTGKAKGMAREFKSAMNEAADQAGVKDVAADLKAVTSKKGLGLDALDDVATKFENWDPMTPEAQKTAVKTKTVEKARKAAAVRERTAAAQKMHDATTKKAAATKAKAVAGKTVAKSTKPAVKSAAKKAAPKAKTATKSTAAPKPKAATKAKAATKTAAKPKAPAKPRATKPKTNTGGKS